MKKMISMLLCLALVLSCAVTAFAENTADPTLNLTDMGMKLTEPAEFNNQEGAGFFMEQGIVTHDPYFSAITAIHLAMDVSRLEEIYASGNQPTEAEQAGIAALSYPLMAAFVTTDVAHAMSKFINNEALTPVEFAQQGNYHYCYVVYPDTFLEEAYNNLAEKYPETYPAGDLEKWKAEGERMRQAAIEAVKAAELFEPIDPDAKLIGQTLQFETVDLEGNPVKSEDLFSKNKFTMINVWGTWCPNCLNEMKELGDIHRELQEKGCGVLGLEYEGQPIEAVKEKALSILSENGCEYPNVVIPSGNTLLDSMITGYPTTIFVDSEGKILTFPIAGAAVPLYEAAIEKLLSGETAGAQEEAPAAADNAPAEDGSAAPNNEQAYRVIVSDGEKPVEGVMIQLCTADTCSLGKTDAEGTAVFLQPEGEYEIHVLKAPDGYAADETVYKTPPTYSDVNITLKPAK